MDMMGHNDDIDIVEIRTKSITNSRMNLCLKQQYNLFNYISIMHIIVHELNQQHVFGTHDCVTFRVSSSIACLTKRF